jgi:hypothetical protein
MKAATAQRVLVVIGTWPLAAEAEAEAEGTALAGGEGAGARSSRHEASSGNDARKISVDVACLIGSPGALP